MYAQATGASSGGRVSVLMPGTQLGTGDEEAPVMMPCTTSVRTGDRVMVTVVDGHPTVTGVVGRGDQIIEETAEQLRAAAEAKTVRATCETAAATAAKEAQPVGEVQEVSAGLVVSVTFTEANTADAPTLELAGVTAPIVTNGMPQAYWQAGATVLFMYDGAEWQCCSTPVYASEVTVGNPGAGNVHVDDDSMDVRVGEEILASFGQSLIELGRNSQDAVIKLCDGLGQIKEEVIARLHALALEGESIALYGTKAAFMTVLSDGVEHSGVWCQGPYLGLNGQDGVTVNTPTYEVLQTKTMNLTGDSKDGGNINVSNLSSVTVKANDKNGTNITCDGAQVCRALGGQIANHSHPASQITGALGIGNGGTGATTAGDARKNLGINIINVYCAYNPNSGEHYFTTNSSEYNNLQKAGWKGQGVAFKALS